jgi:MoaA/NifB/PqqE/SkfB family radical SAM enzyme
MCEAIEIETINRCNNTCAFCPVNKSVDPRPTKKMSDKLFGKIIDDLAEARYSGCIALFSNNEPFVDKDIISRIALAREKCEGALVYILTNGIALDFEKLVQSLDAGLDRLVINNYNDNLLLHDNIREIVERLERPEYENYRDKVEITLRKKNELLQNRAGSAPNKNIQIYKEFLNYHDIGCPFPFRQMAVRSSGHVSLCCNDALGQVTLGDLSTQSVYEVWNGPEFTGIRKQLLSYGRRILKPCNVFDVLMIRHEINILRFRRARERRRGRVT